jgi:hypothetical protein
LLVAELIETVCVVVYVPPLGLNVGVATVAGGGGGVDSGVTAIEAEARSSVFATDVAVTVAVVALVAVAGAVYVTELEVIWVSAPGPFSDQVTPSP